MHPFPYPHVRSQAFELARHLSQVMRTEVRASSLNKAFSTWQQIAEAQAWLKTIISDPWTDIQAMHVQMSAQAFPKTFKALDDAGNASALWQELVDTVVAEVAVAGRSRQEDAHVP